MLSHRPPPPQPIVLTSGLAGKCAEVLPPQAEELLLRPVRGCGDARDNEIVRRVDCGGQVLITEPRRIVFCSAPVQCEADDLDGESEFEHIRGSVPCRLRDSLCCGVDSRQQGGAVLVVDRAKTFKCFVLRCADVASVARCAVDGLDELRADIGHSSLCAADRGQRICVVCAGDTLQRG